MLWTTILSGFVSFFKSPKVIIGGILVVLATAILGLAYLHYTGIVDDNARLREDKARLELAVQEQKQTSQEALSAISEWKDSAKTLTKSLEALVRNQREAAAEGRRLNALFAKHDLAGIARKDPELAARAVNDATARALRLLECASSGDHDCAGADRAPPGAAAPGP